MQNENYTKLQIIGLVLTVILIAAMTMAFVTESSRIESVTAAAEKASLQRGRQLYVDNCVSCHGSRGEGGVGLALNNSVFLKKASNDVIFATIASGRPSTIMPAWGQVYGGAFTDEEIRDIVSFIRAWEPTAPVVETAVFVPDAARGATTYEAVCFNCHGENGKGVDDGNGGTLLAINDPAQLKKHDDAWYQQTITNGRPARGMPSWGTVLSANQTSDMIALLGAWRNGETVAAKTTVAQLINSALFSLQEKDREDALFYLKRARNIAFGEALDRFDPIIENIEADKTSAALDDLTSLSTDWPIGDPVNGETIYVDACKSCHGAEGQGGVGLKLKPSVFVHDSTNADLFQFMLVGRAGTAMRGWDGQLTESQLADVIAFLRTWQEP
ncbi:MAG TPA: c-type cytochrome [Anaerolineales bacterium]|nr:c-type cytochrome [Anaerolineales bacterium]